MPVIVTEDGDILSISYGPHDRGYDNPHFVAIPGDGTGSGTSSPSLLERSIFTFHKPPRGTILPSPQRLGAPLAASPTRTDSLPSSGGKREAPSKKGSQRASGDAKHRRAHKCPKGHYWSYKHKKCVKSKF